MFVCLIFSTNRLFAVIQQSLKNCFHLFYKNWIKYTIHTLHSPSTDTKFIKHLHSIKIISLFAISRTQTHTYTQNKLRSNASITQQTETERNKTIGAYCRIHVQANYRELKILSSNCVFFILSLEWWCCWSEKNGSGTFTVVFQAAERLISYFLSSRNPMSNHE